MSLRWTDLGQTVYKLDETTQHGFKARLKGTMNNVWSSGHLLQNMPQPFSLVLSSNQSIILLWRQLKIKIPRRSLLCGVVSCAMKENKCVLQPAAAIACYRFDKWVVSCNYKFATSFSGGSIWWTLTKERQPWCNLQVKLCDPCLSALRLNAVWRCCISTLPILSFFAIRLFYMKNQTML